MAKKSYNVKVLESEGTCKSDMFELLAQNGDITATKVKDVMGTEITMTGYAVAEITTEEKQFNICYVDTEEYGLVSAGSEIFTSSVKTYFGKCERFLLKSIKTKQGTTYKAVPVLGSTKKEESTEDDLPF